MLLRAFASLDVWQSVPSGANFLLPHYRGLIMKKVTLALSSLTLTLAAAALAQSPNASPMASGAKPPHTQFKSLDTNQDGRISKDEIKANSDLTASFTGLDADHDSYLSENEYAKWKAAPNTMAPANGKPAGSTMPAHPDGVTAPAGDSTKSSTPKDSGGKY
jgi:hypothetical protein